ncbi:MAG: hypothetical protein IPN94_25645 [Sphingobacteriales bacterium]|nr:hypothetical protein [Sphingobacteriales bacterium]
MQFYDYLATTYYANGQQQQAVNVWKPFSPLSLKIKHLSLN